MRMHVELTHLVVRLRHHGGLGMLVRRVFHIAVCPQLPWAQI